MADETRRPSPIGNILIGVGIGSAVTGTTAYLIARAKLRKAQAQLEAARSAQKRAYMSGLKEASERAQEWIDSHVMVIDADNPEDAQKKIDAVFADTKPQTESSSPSPDISLSSESQQKTPVREDDGKISYADDIYAESPDKPKEEIIGENEIGFRFHGKLLKYPRNLFFDAEGQELGELRVRENLRLYETDPKRLNEIWQALGYGEYFPEDGEEPEINLEDWDLNIEGDEPEVKTKERERYLEEVKRYNDNPNEGPRIVSKKEFDEENYLDPVHIYYYAGDNVFVDSTDMDNPVDAVMLLGVSDGGYLFANKPKFPDDEDDNDPDIVYVRNFKMNTIAEVTRFKTAYSAVVDGSVYLNGETDESGGAGGV